MLLSISQVTALAQEQSGSSTAKDVIPSTYANTVEGLKQFLSEMRTAAQQGNQGTLAALVKQTRIPKCDAWLHKMYDSDKADSWMGLCDPKALDGSEASMRELFNRVANVDGRFLARSVNKNPEPGKGLEWGWLQAIRQPLDLYWASWLPASELNESKAEPVGYFMFIDGGFRWESTIKSITVQRVTRADVGGNPREPLNPGKLDQKIEGTTYINRTAHFVLTVPSDWHVTNALVKTTPDVVGTVAAPNSDAAIMVQRYDHPLSTEMVSEIVGESFSKGFQGFRKLSDTPLMIEGESAPSFIFQFEEQSGAQGSQTGKMLAVFIKNENSILGLFCEAPDPQFDPLEDTFKRIVASFRHLSVL